MLFQYKHLPIKSASFQREIEEICKNTWHNKKIDKEIEAKEKKDRKNKDEIKDGMK